MSTPKKLPFTPPFFVISEMRLGEDAHIIDTEGNIIIEASRWKNPRHHKRAMKMICDALNDKWNNEQ